MPTSSARSGVLLVVFLGSGCITTRTSVQRAMLAPLPPAPLLAFDAEHGGEVGLDAQVRPGPVLQTGSTSGIGVPAFQLRGGPMIRVSKKFAFGGAFEVIPGDGAQFQSAESQAISSRRPALGVIVGGHFSTIEFGPFSLEGAAQVSVHGLPVDVARAPGPLSTTPGTTVATETTLIPGIAVTLLPRLTTSVGSFFLGVQAHTNADIEARGQRVNSNVGAINDDLGSTRELLAQVGLAYSITLASRVALAAQAWLPVASQRFGYVPWLGLSVRIGFGDPPAERAARRRPPPASEPFTPEPPYEPPPELPVPPPPSL